LIAKLKLNFSLTSIQLRRQPQILHFGLNLTSKTLKIYDLTYSFDLDPGLGGGLPGWVPVPLVGLVVVGVILGLGHRATVVNKPVK
jgi:hypothetical protein